MSYSNEPTTKSETSSKLAIRNYSDSKIAHILLMAISDINSGINILRLGMSATTIDERTHPDDAKALCDIDSTMQLLRYHAETLRSCYDTLRRDKAQASCNRYFNFNSDGECCEVEAKDFKGSLEDE